MDEGGGGRRRPGVVLPLVPRGESDLAPGRNLALPDLWKAWWLGPGAALTNPNSRKNYKRCEELSRTLGDHPSSVAIEQWGARLVDAGFSPSTVYDVHWYVLGAVFGWGRSKGLIDADPYADAKRVVPPPAESHPVKNIREVWPALLAVAKDATERALLGVYRFAAVRPSEGIAFHPEDVLRQVEPWELSVTKQRANADGWTTTAPKGRRQRGCRRIPVRPELRELLAPLLDAWQPVQMTFNAKRIATRTTRATRFLFPVKRNQLQDLRERLAAVAPEHFGPGHGLHTFRHTCAFELYAAGVEVVTISEWLGHESVLTTEKYLARMAGGKVRADKALGQFFRAPPPPPVAFETLNVSGTWKDDP